MSDVSQTGSVASGIFGGLSGPLAFAATVAAACAYAIAQAWLNHRKPEARASLAVEPSLSAVPTWALYGPVHEVMQTIHDMAEEERKQTAVLQDMSKVLYDIDRGQAHTHRILESVLRNQELGVGNIPPAPSERRRDHENDSLRRTDHRLRRDDERG